MADSKVLRILVTGPDLRQPIGGGVQQHVQYLVQGLSEYAGLELKAFAATRGPRDEPWARKGLRLFGRYLAFIPAVLSSDIVHVNSTIDDRSVYRDAGFSVLARLFRRPVVLQFHGGAVARLKHSSRGAGLFMLRHALSAVAESLFFTQEAAHDMRHLFRFEHVTVAKNYVRASKPGRGARPDSDKLRVAFLGRLEASKGVLELVEAAVPLGQAVEVRIAGDGPARVQLGALLAGSPNAVLIGLVDQHGRDELLAWADVLALPSAHAEGLPYALLEAAAAGCALVSSDIGAIRRIVRPGETGALVSPRNVLELTDTLSWMVANRDAVRMMGEHARAVIAREFSLDQMVQFYGDLYSKLGHSA